MKNVAIIIACFMIILYAFAQNQEEGIIYDQKNREYIITYWDDIDSVYLTAFLVTGDLINLQVQALTDFDKQLGEYIYSYSLLNETNETQYLYSFSILIHEDIIDKIKGIEAPNRNWRGSLLDMSSVVRWVQIHGDLGVGSNDKIEGFTFINKYLPGFTEGYVAGLDGLVAPNEGPVGKIRAEIDSIRVARKHTIVATIGPKPPPDPFVPLDFLDMLIEYKDSSFDLGWITHEGIKNSLNQKLYDARGELEVGNITPAGNILQAFINEVEALNRAGQHITGEAYALLKYNAEYLIGRLE